MKFVLGLLLSGAILAWSGPGHAVIQLAPTIVGASAPGNGANASFIVIDGGWRGSSVLWDESSRQFGAANGLPIGGYAWGTGLWGRADWETVFAPGSSVPRLAQWEQLAAVISYGDSCYNDTWGPTWGQTGALTPPPGTPTLPDGGCPEGAAPKVGNVDNWASRFTGFIRITRPGEYNFSSLYDDGFFFNLYGATGQMVSLGVDYLNPRDRRGFAENLALSVGLYRFELGAWDRLEAGAIDLRWMTPGSREWSLVPTEHLLAFVPLPGTAALLLGAIVGLRVSRRRGAERASR